MAVSHSSKEHRERLHTYREYVPSLYFPGSYGWKAFGGSGHVLTAVERAESASTSNKELSSQSQEASLIVVGDVLPTRFWVDKLGGWKQEFGPMKNAKFSLLLGEPQDIEFRKDWANAVGRINGATSLIAGGASVRSCIQAENAATQIRFGSSVFEPLFVLKQDVTANMLDNLIQTWPVDTEHQAGLDQLKTTHRVNRLKVFDVDESPVLPQHVASTLKGTLVEVHFTIRHWAIRQNKEPTQHTFSCTMNQICILKRAPPIAPNPYNSVVRPYRPMPTRSKVQSVSQIAPTPASEPSSNNEASASQPQSLTPAPEAVQRQEPPLLPQSTSPPTLPPQGPQTISKPTRPLPAALSKETVSGTRRDLATLNIDDLRVLPTTPECYPFPLGTKQVLGPEEHGVLNNEADTGFSTKTITNPLDHVEGLGGGGNVTQEEPSSGNSSVPPSTSRGKAPGSKGNKRKCDDKTVQERSTRARLSV
ncbi:hypothetical protein ARMSODRAFT_978340 [Armillaria solidipes]|uniref:Uncharacterized protein n=1 Tax=Armillaria solidipes TaxID=1076256 RepID=A0A2H3B3X1_9AGAR|nr:hypothetical protein ARMSODRAFT_978340 [Armillaria solidipes]